MVIRFFLISLAIIFFAGSLVISIVFISEGSKRASLRALLMAFIMPAPFLILSFVNQENLYLPGIIVTFVTLGFFILLVIPFRGRRLSYKMGEKASHDERDTMFSRKDLIPGTKAFEEYYLRNKEKEEKDNLWRAEPGLLSPGSLFYNKMAFAAADASFETVKLFSALRDIPSSIKPSDLSPSQVTQFIRSFGKKAGAACVGFTDMKSYHYYTTAGRGDRYGTSVKMQHPYGIVFLTEMDYEMVSSAPRAPVVMESANQYLKSATIATQVAVMIRNLGYSAKTHIDANYDIICPLVGKDAGLGEIGRNGLLISDKFGPRVRISVVTTDLKIQADKPRSDSSVIKFCSICRKCAVNCPSQSISQGKMAYINGVMKWQLDQESCFRYWNHSGTDCGRCISTCPYAHRNNWFHSLIKLGIRNNIFFLRTASFLDDFFYGKRPSSVMLDDLMD